MTLNELATEVTRQNTVKRDFVADTRQLRMAAPMLTLESEEQKYGPPSFEIIGDGDNHAGQFQPTEIFHGQVSERSGIAWRYYQKMRDEAPNLLAHNVNHWFDHAPARRLVRTMEGTARAFLSDHFRPIDHSELLEAVLPVFHEHEVEVVGAEITERKMYVKAVFPRVQADVSVGDPVQAGIIIANSEVGQGRYAVSGFLHRLVCKNGMVGTDILSKHHLGRVIGDIEGAQDTWQILRPETRVKVNEALIAQTQDVVRDALGGAWFKHQIDVLRNAAGIEVQSEDQTIAEVVEVTSEKIGLTEHESGSVLEHLIRGEDLSAWGLANAITRTAQDVGNPDRQVELETAGFQIVSNPQMVLAA